MSNDATTNRLYLLDVEWIAYHKAKPTYTIMHAIDPSTITAIERTIAPVHGTSRVRISTEDGAVYTCQSATDDGEEAIEYVNLFGPR